MSIPLDLDELLKHVRDEASFIQFIKALGADFANHRLMEDLSPSSPYGPSALGWENGSVDAFLYAASAWTDSSAQSAMNHIAVPNVWQRYATILLTGKFYE